MRGEVCFELNGATICVLRLYLRFCPTKQDIRSSEWTTRLLMYYEDKKREKSNYRWMNELWKKKTNHFAPFSHRQLQIRAWGSLQQTENIENKCSSDGLHDDVDSNYRKNRRSRLHQRLTSSDELDSWDKILQQRKRTATLSTKRGSFTLLQELQASCNISRWIMLYELQGRHG